MVHPCCGFPLAKATKYMAIVDLVLSGIHVLLFGIVLIIGLFADIPPDEKGAFRLALFIIFIALIMVIGDTYLAYVLYRGSVERNVEKCSQWFKMKAIVLGVKVLIFFISFVIAATGANFGIKAPTFYIYPLYMLWVVKSYITELKSDPSMGSYNTVGD